MQHSLGQQLTRMVIALLVVVAALFGVQCAYAMQAFADDDGLQTVRVGYYESRNFQTTSQEDGVKSGYGYEYLQRVASYSGWRYEYVYGDWTELYKKLCSGEIDLLAGVSMTSRHKEQVLFPTMSMLNETYYIYKKASDESIVGGKVDTLKGKRIGTIKTTNSARSFSEWLDEVGCKASVVEFETIDAMRSALSAGKIDAFVSSDNVAHNFKDVMPAEIVGKEPYYAAVSKTRPDILAQLNESQSILYTQDRVFIDQLSSRYTADSSANVYLTEPERDYMDAHQSLCIGYLEDYLPFCASENGQPTGLFVDVLAALIDSLPGDWDPQITWRGFSDQTDLFDALSQGEIDIAFPVGGNAWHAEQLGYLRSSAVASTTMSLVYLAQRSYSDVIDKIAVNKHNLLQLYYTQSMYPDAQIIECDGVNACIDAVRSGKASSTVLNGLRAGALLNAQSNVTSVQLPEEDERCFGVRAGNGTLLQIINRGLNIIGSSYGTNASYLYTSGLYTYTAADFFRDYWPGIAALLLFFILAGVCYAVRYFNKLKEEKQREVEQNRRLEEALQAAEQANAAKDVLLANLSHDIRTPLNGILGVLDMNAKTDDPKVLEENREKAHAASRQLLRLIDDLLEMSRLKSGEVEIAEEDFSPCEVVRDVVSSLKVFASEHDVEVSVDDAADCENMLVRGSRAFTRQILENVIDNAIAYNRPGGQVRIVPKLELADEEQAVFSVVVADTGVGMSDESRERLFEPFFQAGRSARSVYPGSGLGMPIVKELVQLMDGDIDVESKLGCGTTVALRIPFAVAKTAGGNPEGEQGRFADIAGTRVLLVEDNELNMEITSFILQEAGAEVIPAFNGADALKMFRMAVPGSIDAIVMDIMMPVMNGIDSAKAIRKIDREDAKGVPIVAITANVSEADKKAVIEAGMNTYLPKPLDAAQLIKTLAELI